MKDQHRGNDRSAPVAGILAAFPWFGMEQISELMNSQRTVLTQGEAMVHLWQASVQSALSSGWALSSELARCESPQAATVVYSDWLQGLYGRLASDSQEAWRLWLTTAQAATVNGFAAAGEAGD